MIRIASFAVLGLLTLPGMARAESLLDAPPPRDRHVHPFEGSLGRPCAYRWRATPSGTRKVRVCY